MSTLSIASDGEKASSYAIHQEVVSTSEENIGHRAMTSDEEEAANFKVTLGTVLAFIACDLGFISDVFVGVGVSAVLSTINADIGPSPNYVWMISSNYVAVSCLSPFVGRVGDIYGRRNCLIAGAITAGIGCIVAATAKDVNTVIGGVVLTGVGSAGHQVAWTCVGEIVPRAYRPVTMGIFESSAAPFSIFGALIAFAVTSNASWRWVFWINAILNLAQIVLVVLFYHPLNQYIHEEGKTKRQQLAGLDWTGVFLFASGLVLFLLGISFGGGRYPWVSAGTLGPMLVGVAVLVVFGLWETYTKNPYKLFPDPVMRNLRGFTIPMGVTFLVGMLYYSTLILWPEEIQVLYTQDLTKVGLYSMAVGLGGTVAGVASGWAFKTFDQGRFIVLGIVATTTLFTGLQALVGTGTHIFSTLCVVMLGACVSAASVGINTMIQLNVPHQYIGVAMGIVITTRNVGGSIATTIYSAILENYLTAHLGLNIGTAVAEAGLPPADIVAVTTALATGDATSPALAAAAMSYPLALEAGLAALKMSYVGAFRLIFEVSIVFGVIGMICALGTRNFGEKLTQKLDVQIETGAHLHNHVDGHAGHIITHDGKELAHDDVEMDGAAY